MVTIQDKIDEIKNGSNYVPGSTKMQEILKGEFNTIIGRNKEELAIKLMRPGTITITNYGFDAGKLEHLAFLEEVFVIKVGNEIEALKALKEAGLAKTSLIIINTITNIGHLVGLKKLAECLMALQGKTVILLAEEYTNFENGKKAISFGGVIKYFSKRVIEADKEVKILR